MVEEAVVAEVVGDEDAAIFITTAKAVVKTAAVKPETASAIETVVRPEVAKPEATESTLSEVAEAAIAKLEITTLVKPASAAEITAASAAETTASSAIGTTAPVCHLC